jgi:2-dehydropantoate 2-reductase
MAYASVGGVRAVRILVYGAGGVGAFFGALLARAGRDVHFVARGAHFEALRSRGLRITSDSIGEVDVPRVSVYPRAAGSGLADLVLVCVKTYQTESILDDLAAVVGDDTVVIPLQNGVEADEQLAARFGPSRVLPAAVYVGATLDEPGVVSHAGPARISIGPRPGFDERRLAAIRETLAADGYVVEASPDIQRERWRKLMWNASFNAESAVTLRTPAELLALPETRALIIQIMGEVVAVACAQGVDLQRSDVDEHIAWTERASGIRTSTMVDRERGRTMEADALIGVIVRRGGEAGVETPASAALHALMKAI